MRRSLLFTACLPLLIVVWACSGGTTKTAAEQPLAEEVFKYYQGNIGGQIRAISSVAVAQEDAEPLPLIMWGVGSAIQYESSSALLGPTLIKKSGPAGAVTDMLIYGPAAAPRIFYAAERGVGIMEMKEGKFIETLFKPIAAGASSVAMLKEAEKTRFLFVTGDGNLMAATEEEITAGTYATIVAASAFAEVGLTYTPVKVTVAPTGTFVLAVRSTAGGLTPTFGQIFDPILENLVTGTPAAIVRSVDLSTQTVTPVAFAATTGKFGLIFDTFVPTDIASDGTNLYIAGLAYNKAAVDAYVAANCGLSVPAEVTQCMGDAAKAGRLTSLVTSTGTSALSGGFFIYRDPTTASTAATHFARVVIQPYATIESAPPLIFHMAVANDKAVIRAPNFLAVMTRSSDPASGEEMWNTALSFDSGKGLYGGVPANVALMNILTDTYIGASFVGVKNEDGSGASALEIVNPDNTLTIADVGAIKTRIEDAGSSYLATISEASMRGGALYLVSSAERKRIEFGSGDPGEYASHAALDGSNLAFSWSVAGQGWHVAIQTGEDTASRGELVLSRTGDSKYFTGFPAITSGDVTELENGRDIADLAFDNGKLFVLLYGFTSGKHYYQAVVFDGGYSSGRFQPVLAGRTNTIYFAGSEADRRARFQRVSKSDAGVYTALFSCAGGLREFQIVPSSSVPSATISTIFASSDIIDLDVDNEANLFAFVRDKTIGIRPLSKPDDDTHFTAFLLPGPEGAAASRLSNSSIVLTSKRLFIASPEGSSAPFWIIDVTHPPTATVLSKCATCHFNGLAVFAASPNQLLASSDTSGVEYYELSGL